MNTIGDALSMYPQDLLQKFGVLSDPEESLRTQIDSFVSSYNSPWDILTELLQNSIDAIHDRRRREDGFTKGNIRITIDSANRSLTVEDNGSGIPPQKHTDLLLPGGSLKKSGNTYGHKGLGFTYCAHVCEKIETQSQHLDGGTSEWSFEGGFAWLNEPSGTTPTLDLSASVGARSLTGPGTAIRLRLAVGTYEQARANTAVIDKFFDWADDEKLLSFVLRTRTAVGQTHTMMGRNPPIEVDVDVELLNSGKTFSVPYSFFDFSSHAPISGSTYPKASDYANHVYLNPAQHDKTHYGIYHLFDEDPEQSPPILTVGKHKGGVKFAAYVFAAGKENLATSLQDYDARLVGSHKYLAISTDVHLSISGMPCGVPMDSWDHFGGFEHRYFAMVDVDLDFGKVLDAGRKTVTRHYVDLFTKKVIELTKNETLFGSAPNNCSFYKLAQQLNSQSSGAPPAKVTDLLANWDNLASLPTDKLLFQKIPDDELGVYVLFGQLAGLGYLPGWKIRYVSSSATYDMALEYVYDFTSSAFGNETVGGDNPIGPGAQAKKSYPKKGQKWSDASGAREFLVAECKVAAENLVKDAHAAKSLKDLNHVDLLVCLEHDEDMLKTLGATVTTETAATRRFSGMTHMLHVGSIKIPTINLTSVIQKLVDAGEL